MKTSETTLASADVSIVITNYNYSRYLGRCIRSCVNQNNITPEIIVVDDCSSDNWKEVTDPFIHDIKLIRLERNVGVAEASNIGIKAAKGRFFMRVDADDFISPDTCYFMHYYLQKNRDAFGVACDYIKVNNYEEKLKRYYADKDNISCGIMYRKDLFIDLGGYNSDMRHKEEEEIRKRLGDKYKIHYLNIPFYRYRMHDNNKTKQPEYKTWEIKHTKGGNLC